ncbi:MAG: PEP/pyruvate-binding domain-containing protein [Bacteroidia bacterium]
MQKKIFSFLIFASFFTLIWAQKMTPAQVKTQVEKYKTDVRGPYRDIRWFCKDGTTVTPQERCPDPGGVQRARYKDEVIALGKSNHIFLGQILSTTPNEDFWDATFDHSRLKQYQLEKYLRTIDNGWVLRKGQYYRGAFQIEDEETWGISFFSWLLNKNDPLEKHFFLVRQAAKDIPHRGDDNKTLSVRAVSKAISDEYPAFMDLRVKIHGQPEAADIPNVKAFRQKHESKLSSDLKKKFDQLIADMESVYRSVDLTELSRFIKVLPKEAQITQSLQDFVKDFQKEQDRQKRASAIAEKLVEIRAATQVVKGPKSRLALLDLSNALEELFFADVNQWNPETVDEAMEKICYSSMAAIGTGLIEAWEWEKLEPVLTEPDAESLTLSELTIFLDRARGLIEWGTGMVNGNYKEVVNLYGEFEPMAFGFFDDRIRGSVLLPLGDAVGELGNFVSRQSNLSNKVMELTNQSTFRGLNPGFALGELEVIMENEDQVEVSKDKIYVFQHPPSDLKPVAGILTVSEGNMVSHVQLLARNLGIPNAVLSIQNMGELKKYAGKKVFYAVSNRGTVIMKPESEMSETEKNLFVVKTRSEERITVPIERMDLSQNTVLNMRQVNAASSGKICGPKAANLGQLKQIFPDHVVEGLVLPFGVFREHMNQTIPGKSQTYWQFLNQTFEKAEEMKKGGKGEAEIETYVLGQLEILRGEIKKMPLLPSFVSDLENKFISVFGKKAGQVPVFLRSDTNMEDLKDFTGAGLNLTIFNVVDREKIIQGIKDVWASPIQSAALNGVSVTCSIRKTYFLPFSSFRVWMLNIQE